MSGAVIVLKPIHHIECSPALAACQRLMLRFALWLCDPAIAGAHISQHNLQPPVLASGIEADWLWAFLQRVYMKQSLLNRAQTVADFLPPQKTALSNWVQAVSTISTQFQPAPNPWPINCPIQSKSDWKAFKELMEAFYEVGFRSGLPYLSDGTPTLLNGVNYALYLSEFREAHRQNPNPETREVCVLCGGPLGATPEVDHWIAKKEFPLLSVCADNLVPICGECNSTTIKGQKPVHSNGSFSDWFHPYLRPGNEVVQITYELHPLKSVHCTATIAADHPKVTNLDSLLKLSARWTREFKAEYCKQLDVLRGREKRRIMAGQPRYTQAEIQLYVQEWEGDLVAREPHHEVHRTLATALQEPARLAAWHSELILVR